MLYSNICKQRSALRRIIKLLFKKFPYCHSISYVDLILSQSTASNTFTRKIHQQKVDQLLYVKNTFNIEVLAIRDNPRYSFNILESLEQRGVEETTKK